MSLDWHPLADNDPLPGDPDAVRDAARKADATADLLEEQAAALEALAASERWESAAVDVLRSEAGELAGGLRRVVPRYRTVGEALRQWAPALEDCQARGRRALRDAQEAQHRADAVAALPALAPDAAATPEGVLEQAARTQRHDAARGDLEHARARLADAVRDRDEAAQRAAQAISAVARRDGLRDGRWDGVRGALDAVGGAWGAVRGWAHRNAAGLHRAGCALGVIALLVSLASGFGLLIVGCAIAAMAIDALLAANGDGSWTDVALDLVGIFLGAVGGRMLKAALARINTAADDVVGRAAAARFRRRAGRRYHRARETLRRPTSTPAQRAAAQRIVDPVDEAAEAVGKAAARAALGSERWWHRVDAFDTDAVKLWTRSRNLSRAHGGRREVQDATRHARRLLAGVAAARGTALALDVSPKIAALVAFLHGRRHRVNNRSAPARQGEARPPRVANGSRRSSPGRPASGRSKSVYGPYVPVPPSRPRAGHPIGRRAAAPSSVGRGSHVGARQRAGAR